MNKRFLSVLLAALMLLSLLPVGVSAAEEEMAPTAELQLPAVTTSVETAPAEAKEPVMETLPMENEPKEYSNESFDYMIQGDGAYISYVFNFSGDTLTIPSELNGYPVKGLRNFYNWQVRHLILPDSVEVIVGNLSLESLTTMTVGAGLKTLDQSQISNCIELQRIDVSDSNPNMKSIDGIVYNAAVDTVLVFPCAWGDTYTIPAGVKNIDAILASGANVKVIYPENSADFITEDGVVYNAEKTKVMTCDETKTGKYVMPETVTEIAPLAFYLCTALTEVEISPNVTEISYAAFAGCTSLTRAALPQGLVSIGGDAFAENDALETLVIPDGVTVIGQRAFYDCDSLTTINMPSSLQEIGAKAFEGNKKQTAQCLVIPAGVTEIGARAFMNTGYLAVDLGEGKPYVSKNAFSNCQQLVSVKIGDNFSYNQFGYRVFSNCTALTTIDFGTGVKSVGSGMFQYCTALTEVTIPANVTTISDNAFSNCTALAKVVIEGKGVQIRERAFADTALKELTFAEGAYTSSIDKHAFYSIDATSVTLPENVTRIGYEAFRGSEKLASLDIPTTVTSMCGKAMLDTAWYNAQEDGAVYLEHVMMKYKGNPTPDAHVVMPEGIRVIGDYAFEAVRSVSALTVGKDVQYVGTGVFDASGVKNVYVHEDNPYYSSENGILYDKNKSRVIYAPVDQIEITDTPYKTQYQVGETIQVGDMAFKLTRRDGSTEDFWYSSWWYPADYIEIGAVDMSTPGTKKVPVTFGACTAEYEITVEVAKGDIDGVPGVNMDDAIYLLFHTSFPEDYPLNQDANFDRIGGVDMDDAIYLLFHTSFPSDYPLL